MLPVLVPQLVVRVLLYALEISHQRAYLQWPLLLRTLLQRIRQQNKVPLKQLPNYLQLRRAKEPISNLIDNNNIHRVRPGVKRVAFDMLFSLPDSDEEEDLRFAESLSLLPVVLAAGRPQARL